MDRTRAPAGRHEEDLLLPVRMRGPAGLGWGSRPVMLIIAVAVMLIVISSLLELANVARTAAEQASIEAQLVTHMLLQQIEQASQGARDPLAAAREDRGVKGVLAAATAEAPSVVYVAVCDSAGIAQVHTVPEMVGRVVDVPRALPQVHSLSQAIGLLLHLRASPPVYGAESAFRIRGARATIRVGIAGGLLRERVNAVFHRGVVVGLLQVALAMIVGFFWAAILRGRLRQLEEGVAALRAGRFDARIPESGVDEFSRLAREMNLLGEQVARERDGQDRSLKHTVDLLGDGILTFGPDRRVVLVNGAAQRALCVSEKAIGLPLTAALPEGHPVRRLAEHLFEGGPASLTVALPGSGSDPAHVAVGHRISGADAPGGGAPGGVLIEIKKTEALEEIHNLVDHSRVLRRLGQMAAGVAHEIRNPLQTIDLQLGRLRGAQDLPPEEVSEIVRTSLEGIQRLQRAVTGFLRVARLQRMSLVSLSPEELLSRVHDRQEAEANLSGLDLELAVEPPLPDVIGDPDVLGQALQNLVANAIQAVPSREGKVILRGVCRDGEVRLSVEDTGPGIPPELQEKVFDLYFTTKEGGTGVGLALARQAVEMHNGIIELNSEPGRGTTVLLRLPVHSVLGEV